MAIELEDWEDIDLCLASDLESEIDAELYTNSESADGDNMVAKALAKAKEEIGNRLSEKYQTFYANSVATMPGWNLSFEDWFGSLGLTWDTIDELLNRIANPSVLKDTAIAWTISKLAKKRRNSVGSDYIDKAEVFKMLEKDWKEERENLIQQAFNLIKFDLNQDGVVSVQERGRSAKGIRRV
jgi:hypothetical protein